jgi:hypothetical protein
MMLKYLRIDSHDLENFTRDGVLNEYPLLNRRLTLCNSMFMSGIIGPLHARVDLIEARALK